MLYFADRSHYIDVFAATQELRFNKFVTALHLVVSFFSPLLSELQIMLR
jgi:hypothetical protein